MQTWTARIIGFVLGIAAFLAVAFLLFSAVGAATHSTWLPRGAGWLFGAIACGVGGARLLEAMALSATPAIKIKATQYRLVLAAWGLWALGVLAWVFIFNPFGSFWSSEEWAFLWKIMLVPPAFASICAFVYHRLGPNRGLGKNDP